MKVAIPITTETEISAHFGRSPAFLVFNVEQGQIQAKEVRPNDQAIADHGNDHSHGHAHDHNKFVRLLGDCQAVIGLGMGSGARHALESAGIKVRLLGGMCSPEEAVLKYESGLLESNPGVCCGGSGNHHHA